VNHCTVTVSATGAKCGKDAVVSFARDGETFYECGDHARAVGSHLGPTRKPSSVDFRGERIRTATGRRYIVCVRHPGSRGFIARRTDSLDTARFVARKTATPGSGATVAIIDTTTGEEKA